MNRLEYWIKAQTQYEVHSPFVFDMYRKVLFARLSRQMKRQVRQQYGSTSAYYQTLYKLADHYHLQLRNRQPDCALLEGPNTPSRILLVDHPHASSATEGRWDELKADPDYQVAIDLYDVGLLIHDPKLHRQHFLLK